MLELREAAVVGSRLFSHYAQQLARLGAFAFGVAAAAAAETPTVSSRARACSSASHPSLSSLACRNMRAHGKRQSLLAKTARDRK